MAVNEQQQDPLALAQSLGAIDAAKPQQQDQSQDPLELARSLGATDDTMPKPQEQEEDLLGAAVRGLKRSWDPMGLVSEGLTKEDIEHKGTVKEGLTEAGTSVLSEIGAGAAAGAAFGPAGVAIGAVGVPLALALYRGFGYERAYSKAKGEDFNLGRAALSVATDVNPLLAKGGKIAKLLSQGALEAGRDLSYGGTAETAMFSGALGGGLASLFHKQGPGWFAALGEVNARPLHPDMDPAVPKDQVDRMVEVLAGKNGPQLNERMYQAAEAKLKEDKDFFSFKRLEELAGHEYDDPAMGNLVPASKNLLSGKPLKLVTGEPVSPDGGPYALELARFKNWLVKQPGVNAREGDVEEAFQQYQRTRGETGVDDAFKWFKLQDIAVAEIDKYNKEVAGSLTKAKDPLRSDIFEKVRDLYFVARKMDRATGLNINGTVQKFAEAKSRQSVEMAPYLQEANELVKQARKLGLKNDRIGRALAMDDLVGTGKYAKDDVLDEAGQLVKLTPDELKIVEGWQDLFEKARKRIGQLGVNIDYIGTTQKWRGDKWQMVNPEAHLKSSPTSLRTPEQYQWQAKKAAEAPSGKHDRYYPNRGLQGVDMQRALRKEMQRLRADHGPDFLDSAEAMGLKRVTAHILGLEEPKMVRTPGLVEQAMEEALDPKKVKVNPGYEAFASFRREGPVIPAFARDMDVGRSFTNYLNSNFKAAIYHDAEMALSTQISALHALGFKKSADYLHRYLNHVSGIPSDLQSKMILRSNEWKAKYQAVVDALDDQGEGNSAKANWNKTLRDLPDFMGFSLAQVYPSFLGWNFKAALRNFSQPWLTTAPELGWGYGMSLAGKASAKVASELGLTKGALHKVRKNFGEIERILQDKGLANGTFWGEGLNLAGDSMRQQKRVGPVLEKLEWYNDRAMALYSASDVVNRYITYHVGQELAKDALAGNQRAMAYLSRLGEGDKAAAKEILRSTAGDAPGEAMARQLKLGDIFARQLIAKTQFNYGKESMNEFGREFGRLGSMFLKWPAAVYSDSADLIDQYGKMEGSKKIVERYIAPLAALMGAGMVADHTIGKDQPMLKYLIGTDLADWAPAQSYALRWNPVMQTGGKATKALLDLFSTEKSAGEKVGSLKNFAVDTASAYTPGFGSLFNEGRRAYRAFYGDN